LDQKQCRSLVYFFFETKNIKLPSFSTYAGASLAFLADLNMNNSNAILELSPSENISNYESNFINIIVFCVVMSV